jgi:alpha-beta hydrolase superfamily lysophospholipase
MYRIVEFPSEGAILRGRLYSQSKDTKPSPVVVMAHGYSATINGMVADRYAEVFNDAGFAVLLYDHRNFGISDGEPRQQINRWVQARGYRDAINFVVTLPEIDESRLAIWGDSMSGAEVIVVGVIDPRVKAIVAQVPACGDEPPPPDPDGLLFASIRETFLNGDVSGTPQTTIGPMPVVSLDQQSIPSMLTPLTAFRWFMEYGGRYGTKWENSVTSTSPATPTPFHPVLCAPHIHAPLLMIIASEDEMPGANSRISRMVFDAASQPKELIEMDGGHFGLLEYPGSLFDQASHAQRDFLERYL